MPSLIALPILFSALAGAAQAVFGYELNGMSRGNDLLISPGSDSLGFAAPPLGKL